MVDLIAQGRGQRRHAACAVQWWIGVVHLHVRDASTRQQTFLTQQVKLYALSKELGVDQSAHRLQMARKRRRKPTSTGIKSRTRQTRTEKGQKTRDSIETTAL